MTSSASSGWRRGGAFSEPRKARTTRGPSPFTLASSWLRPSREDTRPFLLAQAPSGVILRPLLGRSREDLCGLVVLDQHPGAAAVVDLEAEERRPVGDARRLLHVVRDDHDRVVALELVHQLLDPLRRDRVECGRRLVE